MEKTLVNINIVSPDARRLANFYRDVLGADVCFDHGGPQRIELWFGPRGDQTTCIVINQDIAYQRPDTQACQGFEFRVKDAWAEYQKMQELGIALEKPPEDLPWGYRYFHIKDPDGNGIDIVEAL